MTGPMAAYPLHAYACGHVGRVNEGYSPSTGVKTFIRVAHIRDTRVEKAGGPCPNCQM